MGERLEKYRNLQCKLPDKNLAWRMKEAGVENFGTDGWDELDLPKPKSDEILVRVDAIGICFSDVKLVTQGANHPRITGRDLEKEPVTPGHEVSLTILEVGDKWKNDYKPGERYIVQADVYYNGVNIAYGYALAGGMQQYGIIGEPVLNGDEGSYIIPIKKQETGYAEAALVEPWTCVVASYRIYPRTAVKNGGNTLVVCVEDGEYVFDKALVANGKPEKVLVAGASEATSGKIADCFGTGPVEVGPLKAENVNALKQERTGDKGFDDVIVLGTPEPELAEELGKALANRAVMAIVAESPISRKVEIDVGRVHYDYIDYVGTKSKNVADAYTGNRTSELLCNASSWFIGAAGPMGQMHVQRAVGMHDCPKKMLCTDVDNGRLDYLKSGVDTVAKEKGIELEFMNPLEAGNDALSSKIEDMTNGSGFDDIVILAPVVALIEGSVDHLAENGLMNIFAGVPRGTIAKLDLSLTYMRGIRFVGSSGSLAKDMVDTLAFTEDGTLPTINSLAAIGGIEAMAEGLRSVKEARFPGKTVIFPHIKMPLTALADLADVAPEVKAKLREGKFWTNEAEEVLLESKLENCD